MKKCIKIFILLAGKRWYPWIINKFKLFAQTIYFLFGIRHLFFLFTFIMVQFKLLRRE